MTMLLTKTTVTRFEKRVNMLNDKLCTLASDFKMLENELKDTVFEDNLSELAISANTALSAFTPVTMFIKDLNTELKKLYK